MIGDPVDFPGRVVDRLARSFSRDLGLLRSRAGLVGGYFSALRRLTRLFRPELGLLYLSGGGSTRPQTEGRRKNKRRYGKPSPADPHTPHRLFTRLHDLQL